MRTHRPNRSWSIRLVLLALVASVVATTAVAPTMAQDTDAYVVQAADATLAAAVVESYGGQVDTPLPIIGGVAARLDAPAAARVASLDGVSVAPDIELTLASTAFEAAGVGDDGLPRQLAAMNPPADFDVTASGAGVGVALLDTGVSRVPGLDGDGQVLYGPNLSDEDGNDDAYGHGTFMAGLIAGRGEVPGSAPGAHIVSVKLAGSDGVTSLARVIEGIGWVVVHADDFDIEVLNLSFGVPTNVAPQADPLAAAVEAAWAAGIVVVVASGNEGAGTVTSPGRDPWVITVGAVDVLTDTTTVPSWSGSGRVGPVMKPELLAPGVSTISLRVPGSRIDRAHPEARVGPDNAETHFRGSGTSMATALVSGAAAVLLETRPFATPDDVKAAMVRSGQPVARATGVLVDLAAADAIDADDRWNQRFPISFRGLDGVVGSQMPWAQRGAPGPTATWQRARWADVEAARARWAETAFLRARWAEELFQRARWAEDSFTRARWADDAFVRARWADDGFARARWADDGFARARWADINLTRARWAEADWARARWANLAAGGDLWVRARWAEFAWPGDDVAR